MCNHNKVLLWTVQKKLRLGIMEQQKAIMISQHIELTIWKSIILEWTTSLDSSSGTLNLV